MRQRLLTCRVPVRIATNRIRGFQITVADQRAAQKLLQASLIVLEVSTSRNPLVIRKKARNKNIEALNQAKLAFQAPISLEDLRWVLNPCSFFLIAGSRQTAPCSAFDQACAIIGPILLMTA